MVNHVNHGLENAKEDGGLQGHALRDHHWRLSCCVRAHIPTSMMLQVEGEKSVLFH